MVLLRNNLINREAAPSLLIPNSYLLSCNGVSAMKKLFPIIFLLLLSSCRIRDTARLRSVETIGVDYADGCYTLSISTGEGNDELPGLHLSGSGETLEAAMNTLEEQSDGQELFYAHCRYVVLGENALPALPGLFDRFERAPELRMALPLFCCRGKAETLVTDEENEVGSLLRSLTESAESSGTCHIYTLLDCDRSLREEGYALCAAIDDEELSGYALLGGDTILYSTPEAAIGLTLLRAGLEYARLSIPVGDAYAAVETEKCHSSLCRYSLRELPSEVSEEELNAAVEAYLYSVTEAAAAFLGTECGTSYHAQLIRGYDLTRSHAP